MDSVVQEQLSRFMNESRETSIKQTEAINIINESVIIIRERTKILPDLQDKVRVNEDALLIINNTHEIEEENQKKTRKNVKFFMYSVGFIILMATTYSSILAYIAK